MSAAYARYRFKLLQDIMDEGLTPNQVAERLESEGLKQTCSGEIAMYRLWGESWPKAAVSQRKQW